MRLSERSAPAVSQFSEAEWHVRVELAALYRALHRLGMTDLIYNHITCRVPGENHAFLINSYGMMYSEVTASSLFKVDLDGNVLHDPQNGYSFNPAGFVIHSAVHRGRHDVACVLHSHTRASMAVSAMQEGLLPISQQACKFDGTISLHAFNGPVLDLSEQARLLRDLGDNNVMLLRNHGTLVCGKTIAERHFWMHTSSRLPARCRSTSWRQGRASSSRPMRFGRIRGGFIGSRAWTVSLSGKRCAV